MLARLPILAALRGAVALRIMTWLAFGLAVALLATACASNASAGAAPTASTTGSSAQSTAAQAQTFTVNMTDSNTFEPATLTIPVGSTVTWVNVGQPSLNVEHTTTDNPTLAVNPADSVLPDGAQPWHQGDLHPGQSFSVTFTVPGTYQYFCRYHETVGMLGTLIVTP